MKELSTSVFRMIFSVLLLLTEFQTESFVTECYRITVMEGGNHIIWRGVLLKFQLKEAMRKNPPKNDMF